MDARNLLYSCLLLVNSMSFVPADHHTPLNFVFIASPSNGEETIGLLPAVQMAVEDINGLREAGDTILEGYNLTGVVQGAPASQCSRKDALDILHRHLYDNISDIGILGAGCSLATEAVAEVSQFFKLPMVSCSSLSGDILEDDEYSPYLLQAVPSMDYVAVGLAEITRHYRWNKAVIISQEDNMEFASITDHLYQELIQMNPDFNVTVIHYPRRLNELPRINFFPFDYRIFVLNVGPKEAKQILCYARSVLNWSEHSYVWLTQGWYEEQWWNSSSDSDSTSQANCTSEELLQFLQEQRALGIDHYPMAVNTTTETTTSGITPEEFESEYRHLVEEAGLTYTRISFFAYDALWSMALGLNAALEDLHICGTGTSLTDFNPLDRQTGGLKSCIGKVLVDSIHEISFNGVSGPFSFRNGSRMANRLSVFQYYSNGTKEIGSIHRDQQDLFKYYEKEATLWLEGDVIKIPKNENHHYLALVVTSYVINSIVILAALFCFIFTIAYRNRRLVKLTSPYINCIIIAGVIILGISTFMFSYPPVSTTTITAFCYLRIWLVSMGLSFCFGSINAKMGRIYYIFRNPLVKKKTVNDWYLILFVLLLLLIDTIILIPTSVLESARFSPRDFPDMEHQDEENAMVTLCISSKGLLVLGFLFGYKALIQATGLILAAQIRKVKIKVLNDSREITLTLYLSSFILFIVVIVTVVLSDHLNIYSAMYCYGIPLATSTVLIVVFFSKMLKLYRDPNGDMIFTTAASSSALKEETPSDTIIQLEKKVKELTRKISKAEAEHKAEPSLPTGKDKVMAFQVQN